MEIYGDGILRSSQGSAFIAFLEATDGEQAIRLAISLGGDSDTLACIAGAIAGAYFGPMPAAITAEVRHRLPADLLAVVDAFSRRYGLNFYLAD